MPVLAYHIQETRTQGATETGRQRDQRTELWSLAHCPLFRVTDHVDQLAQDVIVGGVEVAAGFGLQVAALGSKLEPDLSHCGTLGC